MSYSNILSGLYINSQLNLNPKNTFDTLDELKDLGEDDIKAYEYYNNMFVYCGETKAFYVWKEINEEEEGIIDTNFIYPSGHTANGFDYGTKEFNFVITTSLSEGGLETIIVDTNTTISDEFNSKFLIVNQLPNNDPVEITLPFVPFVNVNNSQNITKDLYVRLIQNTDISPVFVTGANVILNHKDSITPRFDRKKCIIDIYYLGNNNWLIVPITKQSPHYVADTGSTVVLSEVGTICNKDNPSTQNAFVVDSSSFGWGRVVISTTGKTDFPTVNTGTVRPSINFKADEVFDLWIDNSLGTLEYYFTAR